MQISGLLPWCFLFFVFAVSFSIALAHIALGLWLLVWFVSLAMGQSHWKRTPLDGAVLIFLTVDLFTGLTGINPMRSLVHFVSLWHVSIYMLIVNTVVERRWLERSLAILFIMVGLNASIGIAQYFGQGLYFMRSEHEVIHWAIGHRELGTFSHPMTFAGQIMLVGLMGVSVLIWWQRFPAAWRWTLPVVIILTAWVLSYVRNAWVGMFAGLLVLGLMRGKRTVITIGCAVTFVVLFMSILQPSFLARVKSIVNPAVFSNLERINMGKVTFEIFKNAPFLGVGVGNYSQASEPYRSKYNVISKSHPHSNILTQIAEKGALGLCVFVYMWYVFFKQSWRAWRNTADDLSRAVVAGGIAALIGFHVAGLFESNFGDSEVAMMMWLMVGFVMSVRVRFSDRFADPVLNRPQ